MSSIMWVAEIGSMHKGNKALAYEMIRRFAEAGATICKFQFGWNEDAQKAHGLFQNPIRYVDEWAEDLNKWCDYFGVELMASIWSRDGLEAAHNIHMKRYKIAHQMWDNDNESALEIISELKETFVSGATPDLLKNWEWAHSICCNPYYPTYPAALEMPTYFGSREFAWYGYSDHSHGIAPCLLAVSRGALYIEKHVCLDKTDLVVKDTPFSATPEEFAEMVRLGNEMRRLLDAGV